MHLYVQPRLFASDHAPPVLGQLTVAACDGTWSIGAAVTDLTTLQPLAITAGSGQEALAARTDAHSWLDELLDVLQELSEDPFG